MSRLSSKNILLPALSLTVILLLGIYAFFDPMETWWMPKCPVHLLTGFSCPGCGSQRAIHALLHGNLEEAFKENALLLVMIPYLAVLAYAEATQKHHPRLFRILFHPASIISILIAVIGWTIFRNL